MYDTVMIDMSALIKQRFKTVCYVCGYMQAVRNERGNCSETMYRKSWDVKEFIGQYAQVRLVDKRDFRWGHINFDDLKGDIICPHYLYEDN